MIFDLTCTGQDGELFIIEVQRIRQQYFKDRSVYYCSRLIHDQAPKGSKWDYSLKEVYFIGLMDFALCWRKNEAQEKSDGFLCHVKKSQMLL